MLLIKCIVTPPLPWFSWLGKQGKKMGCFLVVLMPKSDLRNASCFVMVMSNVLNFGKNGLKEHWGFILWIFLKWLKLQYGTFL